MAPQKKKTSKKIAYLQRLYANVSRPGSYQSARKLLATVRREKKFKFTEEEIQRWLQGEESHTVHKRPLRRFPRIPVIVDGLGDQYDADLMIMKDLANANDEYKYVLVMVDVFSRYTWVEPMELKNEQHSMDAFKKLFDRAPPPRRLRTDKGGEFTGKRIESYFDALGILHFVTYNEIKANYAERVIQTLKKKLFRYLTAKRTRTYIDVLQEAVSSYNRTSHSRLGMAPADVNEENEAELWQRLYLDAMGPVSKRYKKFKYQVGDTVRLSLKRNRLEREYDERWTNEVFRIRRRFYNKGIKQYKVEDYSGVSKPGSYYEAEIQKVSVSDQKLWRVDAILDHRGTGPDREVLVRWHGWSKKYDEWIPAGFIV